MNINIDQIIPDFFFFKLFPIYRENLNELSFPVSLKLYTTVV